MSMRFLRRIPVFWLVVIPLLLPGLLVASWRLVFRHLAEQRNVFVETVVDFEEIRQLAREEGWSLKELFDALRKNGASSVAVSEDTLASLESEGKITVLNSKEIRKLSLEETFEMDPPAGTNTLGSLWVHSDDTALLDRIEQTLSWKIPADSLVRIHRNLLLINKSSKGFRERVGLGFSSEYFQMADDAGLGLVVRVFNYPGLTADSAAKIINSIPTPASVSALLFAEEEMLGSRGELNKIVSLFKDRSYRIGWVEFNLQDGIESYLQGLATSRPFVRVHSISRKELDQVYNVKRSVARWVRAVKDRSLKMLYIRCFFQDDKKFIENLATFNLDYLSRTVKELNEAGFRVATNTVERMHEPRHIVGKMSIYEVLAIGLALFIGLLILMRVSFWPALDANWSLIFVAAFLFCFMVMSRSSFIAVSGLTGAVAWSCIGVIAAMQGLQMAKAGFFRSLPRFVITMVMPSVIGGLLIAGIYSEIEFLLKFEQFRGIKLAFILPLLITGLWALRQYGRGCFALLHKPVTPVGGILLAVAAASVALYVLRSGNVTFLKPSEAEDSFRTFLENILVARPRNKEFLVGYPAGLLFIFFYLRRNFAILPLLAVFMQMGQVSAVNSLCHFHTPLMLSLLRIFNGLWLGVVLGLGAVLVLAFFNLVLKLGAEKEKKAFLAGYFGFGNAGDELLWKSFYRRFNAERPDYRLVILNRNDASDSAEVSPNVSFVSRRDLFAVAEELLTAEIFVIPGGSVFQSATSRLSLVFYLALVFLARICGAGVFLPAQGLGPFRKDNILDRLLADWLAIELSQASYFSVRDSESADLAKEITGVSPVNACADLVFLNETQVAGRPAKHKGNLRVAAIIRSSVSGSEKIAADLVSMKAELENLTLIPVAFQPEEDEKVWRQAGWQGDILYAGEPLQALSDFDVVLSMRLHGCIVATSLAIPWIGIAYDPKVTAFAAACRWQFCCPPSEITRSWLEEKLNSIAGRRQELADRLHRITGENRRAISEDFASLLQKV